MIGDELQLFESENAIDIQNSMVPFRYDSEISQRFRLEEEYKILPVSAIWGRAYCVPLGKEEGQCEYIHIKLSDEWSSSFLLDSGIE